MNIEELAERLAAVERLALRLDADLFHPGGFWEALEKLRKEHEELEALTLRTFDQYERHLHIILGRLPGGAPPLDIGIRRGTWSDLDDLITAIDRLLECHEATVVSAVDWDNAWAGVAKKREAFR
jgi:hypothetical protein